MCVDIEYFKDKIFELLNETNDIGISDIETYDKENVFKVFFQNEEIFEIECRQVLH